MRLARPLLVLAALLAGCQSLGSYQDDPGSRYYAVPEGARFTLNRELRFEPHELSLYIQDGRILNWRNVQQYDPFCKFQLEQLSEARRTVGPAGMVVTRTLQYQMETTFSQAAPLHYAQLSFGLSAQAGGGEPQGGVPLYSFIMRMDLDSAEEPQIFRLTCARWYYPGMEDRVTVSEIRRTLAPILTLRLPAGDAGTTKTN